MSASDQTFYILQKRTLHLLPSGNARRSMELNASIPVLSRLDFSTSIIYGTYAINPDATRLFQPHPATARATTRRRCLRRTIRKGDTCAPLCYTARRTRPTSLEPSEKGI
jgi:hypothetical protein